MLNRISDFYRIVNPEPSDALITQRKEAIVAFMEQLPERKLQFACADIAGFGLSSTPTAPQANAADSIIAAIQVPQPSFSSDIGANALDLRVFAGIALGEYLGTHGDGVTAALVISALATRALPQERYLAEFISALLEAAQKSAGAAGRARRERPQLEIATLQGGDVPSLLKSVQGALHIFRKAIDQNLRADQEELDILWWVFGGHSKTLGKPFHALDVPHRILASAGELAELVILPPSSGSTHFLHATLKEDCALSLRRLIEPCTSSVLETVTRHRDGAAIVLATHPALLPLTWLSCRRLDSGTTPGWEAEFEQKTHLAAGEERTGLIWATQIFNECVAVRLLDMDSEEQSEE